MRKKVKNFIFAVKGLENRHKLPHVHIEYQNNEVVVSLIDFSVLAGKINKQSIAINILINSPELVIELIEVFYILNPNLKK